MLPPGQLTPAIDAAASQAQIFGFGNGQCTEIPLDRYDRIDEIQRNHPYLWINVNGLKDVHLIEELGRRFQLHPLALEDVVNQHQLAKCEDYEQNIFFVSRMLNLEPHWEHEQLSMFVGANYIITLQEIPGDCFDSVRKRLRSGKGKLALSGPDFLAYSLLDSLIDSYFPFLDRVADDLDSIEDQVAEGSTARTIEGIHEVRNRLMVLRRAIRPLRDALGQLMRAPSHLMTEETKLFLRDCYDHAIQLLELLETYRELCADLREYHLSMISFRMNEVMKVLTVIATIFIPLSFIASVYGMNFDTAHPWNMPELEWPWGYPFALLLMLLTAVGFLWFFWRRGWIFADSTPSKKDPM